MFRHDDIGPDVEEQLIPSPVNSLDKPLPASVSAQEGLSPKTGKGEGMGMAWCVVPFARLAVGRVHAPVSKRTRAIGIRYGGTRTVMLPPSPLKAVGMAPGGGALPVFNLEGQHLPKASDGKFDINRVQFAGRFVSRIGHS
jgi:hypothetical protein